MRIVCDVDGVLAALHPEWCNWYNLLHDDNLSVEQMFKTWDVHEHVKCQHAVYDIFKDPELYARVAVVEGAQAGVAALRSMGHEVIFATSCSYGMVDQKARWMEHQGFVLSRGHQLPAGFIPIEDKAILAGDLLIDDGGHNIKAWVMGTRRRAILLEQSHNADLDLHSMFWHWVKRASNWADIVKHVEELSV